MAQVVPGDTAWTARAMATSPAKYGARPVAVKMSTETAAAIPNGIARDTLLIPQLA